VSIKTFIYAWPCARACTRRRPAFVIAHKVLCQFSSELRCFLRQRNADKVIAFHRWENGGPGDDVVIVANFGNRSYGSYALGFPRAGAWRVRFNSDWQGYSSDFGNQLGYHPFAGGGSRDGMPFEANVGLGPYSVLILSQD
jgi:1,4-alpha-glucan branching enzyme